MNEFPLITLMQMYNSDSNPSSNDGSHNMSVTKELIEKMLGKEATALETLLCKVQHFLAWFGFLSSWIILTMDELHLTSP